MFEARRIPPTARGTAPPTPSREVSAGAPPLLAARGRRTPSVVGSITPTYVAGLGAAPRAEATQPATMQATMQARAADAWRAWTGARPADAEPGAAGGAPSGHDAGVPATHAENAEMLVWHNRLRLAFVAAFAAAVVVLRATGVLRATSVLAPLFGVRPLASGFLVILAAYLLTVVLLQRHARRTGGAGELVVGTLVVADQVVAFSGVFLLTSPAHYVRALIFAFFSLQLTQTFVGRRAATLSVVVAVAGYLALLGGAAAAGAPIGWGDELWTLALFASGLAYFVRAQSTAAARLGRLVQLFESAQEGDVSRHYDEAADVRPDRITRVGRAYNRMRVQLSTIVLTDPLSGCLNRRGFDQQLARETARAARAGTELALVAIDVDYFKRINDTFGHLAGDQVIREVGQLLREATRTGDLVARVGGEEFMVLAPDTGAAGAFNVASRIVDAFRKRQFEGVAGRIPVTASAGVVADLARTPHIGEDLKARADEALYAAKRGGRNRVAVWSGERRPT